MSVVSPIPKVAKPGAGKKLSVVGETVTILLSGEDTGGTLALIEEWSPPQGGPPLHVHHHEDETFVVLEGEYEFQLRGEAVRATQGSVVFAPKDQPHTFKNVGATAGHMLISLTPAGFERFFVEVDQIPPERQMDPDRLTAIAKKYDLEFLF